MRKLLKFKNVYIAASCATVGKKEYEGPLRGRFDSYDEDEYFGKKDFESAESEMARRNLNLLLAKAKSNYDDVDVVVGGDLVNQCTPTCFSLKGTGIPFLGLYGACSTIVESIICSAAFIENGYTSNAVAMASSHFCTAERQFRFPLEYGSTHTPTSQNTVTGAGAFLLENKRSNIKLESAVIGRIIDKGVTDANNMGAAMATAAADTAERFFINSGISPSEIDLIVTGDLGIEGNAITQELLCRDGYITNSNFTDCGILIYDPEKQDTHSGGSGCGCMASVLASHLIKLMHEDKIKNLLAIATGALLNTDSVMQKRSIPGIAHAVYLRNIGI